MYYEVTGSLPNNMFAVVTSHGECSWRERCLHRSVERPRMDIGLPLCERADMQKLAEWITSCVVASAGLLCSVMGCGTPGPTPVVTVPAPTGTASGEPATAGAFDRTIVCGKATCAAPKEACCEGSSPVESKCVPVGADGRYACPDPSSRSLRCDDAGDCAAGSVCCDKYWSDDTPAEALCEPGICTTSTFEYCTASSACRPGHKCVLKGEGARGYCAQVSRTVKCGEVTCSGKQSVCCWNSATKKGTCAEECKVEPDVAHLSCTSSDDCAGYVCANDGRSMMNPNAPALAMSCMSPYETGNSTHATCKKVGDCPERTVYGGKVKGCEDAGAEMPPGSRWCTYSEE